MTQVELRELITLQYFGEEWVNNLLKLENQEQYQNFQERCQIDRQIDESEVQVFVAYSCSTLWTPQGLQPDRLFCPRNSPGKNTEVGSHSLLQGIFPTQGQTQVSCIAGGFFTIQATREIVSNQSIDSMQFQSNSQKILCVYVHMSSNHALDKEHISEMASYQIFF